MGNCTTCNTPPPPTATCSCLSPSTPAWNIKKTLCSKTLSPLKATGVHQKLVKDSQSPRHLVVKTGSPLFAHSPVSHQPSNFCHHILFTPAQSHPVSLITSNMDQLHRDTFGHDDVADSTCDAEDTDDDVDGSTYEKKWEERLVRHRRRYARQQDELDWLQWQDAIPRGIEQAQTSDPGDAEDEQVHAMGSPNFSSPALQLVWGRFMSHHQLGIFIGQNVTNLRRAALVTFGPSHRRGAAHAVGLWANSDDGSIFFRLGCWIRRQREMLFGLLFDS